MTKLDMLANALVLAAVLCAAGVGLCAHLLRLAITDWRGLADVLGMRREVAIA